MAASPVRPGLPGRPRARVVVRIATRHVPGALRLTAPAGSRSSAGLALGVGLGLLALGPGLRRGFLLSYDMVIVPREPFTTTMFGLAGGPPRAVPSDAVLAVFSRIVPADIAQKLVLLSIFVLACAGAAALLEREPWFARLAAGVIYAWNPFVAERLLIGQWALLLGYAGLPWALRAIITAPVASWRGAGRLGLALLPAAVGGFAAMAISALVVVPAAVLAPGGPARRRLISASAALAVLAVASLPWLIPSLLRTVSADPAGIAAFAARADTPFGSLGSLLMLGGIWNAQTVPAGYGGAWSALWLALVLAAAASYVAFGLRRHRWPGLTFAAVAGLAIASIGVTAAGTRDRGRACAGTRPAPARAGLGGGRAAAPGLVSGGLDGSGADDRSQPGSGGGAAAALGGFPPARLERRAGRAGPVAAAGVTAGGLEHRPAGRGRQAQAR